VSSLHPGDRELHHEDGSHRWGGGPIDGPGQKAWQAKVEAHKDAHRAELRTGPQRPARTLHRVGVVA
jgi:hypothetical protein